MSSPAMTEAPEKVAAPKPAHEPPFNAKELEAFQSEDCRAAASIACIMVAIFIAAVIGYTYVCFLAYSTPWR
jgi:hypothetical protein